MRVTAEEKDATRRRILDSAVRLFKAQGFEETTTREIAAAAEIATGTLFNYFTSKEAIVASVAEESLAKAHAALDQLPSAAVALEEALFALVAAELRQLKPLRKFIVPLLETALSPLTIARAEANGSLRAGHLEVVAGMARQRGLGELSPMALQVYWTLYTGVLAFWAGDKSPKQEDTLALLDESMGMFVSWLQTGKNHEHFNI
jgi:AcrR family transcriptional regulator